MFGEVAGLNRLRYMILLHQSSVCSLLTEMEWCYTGIRAHRPGLTLYVRVYTKRLTRVPDIHGKWCRYAHRPLIAAVVAGFCSSWTAQVSQGTPHTMAGPPALGFLFKVQTFRNVVGENQVLVRLSWLNLLRYKILQHESSACIEIAWS